MFMVCDLCIWPCPRSHSPVIHLLLSVCEAKKGEDNQRLTPSHWEMLLTLGMENSFLRHCLYRWIYWSMQCVWRREFLTAYQCFHAPNHCSVLNISIIYKLNSEISHNVLLVFYVTETKNARAESQKMHRQSCTFIINFIGLDGMFQKKFSL